MDMYGCTVLSLGGQASADVLGYFMTAFCTCRNYVRVGLFLIVS
jgi:hypothetical protein